MKKLLLGACTAVGMLGLVGCAVETGPGYGYAGYSDYPAVYATAPGPDYVWVGGDWYIDGGHWRQHAGRWERPPYHGARYRSGYWGGRHEWHRGEWR